MSIKKWLRERYLPAYLRDDLLEENKRLRKCVEDQEHEIQRLNSYIDGMMDAMVRTRVVIKAGKVEKK